MSFRHPKGLYLLFMTEMWERFSFYTMQALLVLYATAALAEGGLAMNSAKAIALFGYYGAAVYIMPLLGAYFADRKIGLQRAVIIGGVLMAIGHFLMVFNQELTFYLALAFLAAGNGFFKPCITSLLGCLYDDQPQGKDSAYSIFYMGINVGALLAGIVGGALHVYYGFDYAFGTAGIGMCIGLATFLWGRKRYLGNVGLEPIVKHEEAATVSLTSEEKRRIWGLMSVCLFMTAFFIGYWQYGGAMTLYAESYTDRMLGSFEVPTAWFFSLNPLFIILCCHIMGIVWSRLGTYISVCLGIRNIL
ncbi:MAG: peptide MFS transporter, partial [Chlamydiia bacterium]|nr:peptide MFS transporter [Chlamydiia bacterium]